MDASAIDGDFLAARSRSVHVLDTGNATVLFDTDAGVFLILNPTGALVWRCLDGTSSIAAISADIADVLQAPPASVLAETLELVRKMVFKELVRDARCPEELGDRAPARASAVELDARFEAAPEARFTVAVDGRRVGIRVNDAAMCAQLRAAFARRVQPDDDAEPSLSLWFGADRGSIAALHSIYDEEGCLLRTADRARLLHAAVMAAADRLVSDVDAVPLRGVTVLSKRGATVVLGRDLESLQIAAPRLRRRGLFVVDGHRPCLDRDALDVVVADPALLLGDGGWAPLEEGTPTRQPPDRSGRHPLRSVVVVGTLRGDEPPSDDEERLEALLPALGQLADNDRDRGLALLVRLLADARITWVPGFDDRELLAVVAGRA